MEEERHTAPSSPVEKPAAPLRTTSVSICFLRLQVADGGDVGLLTSIREFVTATTAQRLRDSGSSHAEAEAGVGWVGSGGDATGGDFGGFKALLDRCELGVESGGERC